MEEEGDEYIGTDDPEHQLDKTLSGGLLSTIFFAGQLPFLYSSPHLFLVPPGRVAGDQVAQLLQRLPNCINRDFIDKVGQHEKEQAPVSPS